MKLAKRILMYCIGIMTLSFGVAFSVSINLGVSPISSMPYALSLVTGINLGSVTTSVMIFFLILQWLLLGKEFKPSNFLQIIASFVYGYFVHIASYFVSFISISDFIVIRVLMLLFSIAIISLGISLYTSAKIIPIPADGMVLVIAEKLNKKMGNIKVYFDCGMVIAAASICIIFLGRIDSVGLGTIITALGVGRCLGFFNRKLYISLSKFYETYEEGQLI
ncbi:MAG: YczE/YyaS/YitT family protein [Anaerotignaceae bacterium]